MLSMSRCRKLLGDAGHLSDDEIERLRDDLYVMAEVALDLWKQRSRSRAALVAAADDGNTGDGNRGAQQSGGVSRAGTPPEHESATALKTVADEIEGAISGFNRVKVTSIDEQLAKARDEWLESVRREQAAPSESADPPNPTNSSDTVAPARR